MPIDQNYYPSDFNSAHLYIIMYFMQGLGYITMFNIHEKNEVNLGIENMAMICKEVDKSFSTAYELY